MQNEAGIFYCPKSYQVETKVTSFVFVISLLIISIQEVLIFLSEISKVFKIQDWE